MTSRTRFPSHSCSVFSASFNRPSTRECDTNYLIFRNIVTSRKRKIEELYRVTLLTPEAGAYPSPKDATATAAFEDNLQQFLDANDITKGRFLSLDSLPSRPTPPPTPKNASPLLPPSQDAQPIQDDTPSQRHSTPPRISKHHRSGNLSPPYSPGSHDAAPKSSAKEHLPKSPTSAPDEHSIELPSSPVKTRHDTSTLDRASKGVSASSRSRMDDVQSHAPSSPAKSLQPHAHYRKTSGISRKRKRSQCKSIVLTKLAKIRPPPREDRTAMQKDYMGLLFQKQSMDSIHRPDLFGLINASGKSVSTSDYALAISEKQNCTAIKRVYDLQQGGQWTMRQLRPISEPKTKSCGYDQLLKDVKWLQRDFREERKLKITVAKSLATWCAEYVQAEPYERRALQTPVCANRSTMQSSQSPMVSPMGSQIEKRTDVDILDLNGTQSLFLDESCFPSKFLGSIPKFGIQHSFFTPPPSVDLESEAVDVAIKVEEKPQLDAFALPASPESDTIPAEDSACALFNPEWRPLRARVNALWAFRPPAGTMPPSAFYENRRASLWTQEDDQQLRSYVKDFPSNWALISDRMTGRSLFHSSQDRRTPWECYERLLALEPAPADSSTRTFFRHFSGRLDQAKSRFLQTHAANQQQVQQLAQQSGQPAPNIQMPKFPVPHRVERKPTNRKYIGLLEGARKLAKKREAAQAKQAQQLQQQQSQPAQPTQDGPPNPQHPPSYFSELKFKRQLHEQAALESRRQQQRVSIPYSYMSYGDSQAKQQAYLQAQQAAHQARQSGNGNQPLFSGISQRMGSQSGTPNVSTTANGHLAVPNQSQGRAAMQGMPMPNGMNKGIMPANAAQMAQMAAANNRTAMTPNQQRIMAQASGTNSAMMDSQVAFMQAQQRGLQLSQQRPGSQQMMSAGSGSMAQGNHGIAAAQNGLQFNQQQQQQQQQQQNGDKLSSPHQMQGSQSSPNMAFHQAASNIPGTPQGQVNGHRRPSSQSNPIYNDTVMSRIRADINNEFPDATEEKKQQELTNRLRTYHYAVSRQNALNAATGAHNSQSNTPMMNGQMSQNGRPQSPYTPQANGNVPQNLYQQQALLAANMSNGQNGFPNGMGNAPSQAQYSTMLRAQMQKSQQQLQQQIINGSPNMTSSNMTQGSPNMSNAAMNMSNMYNNQSANNSNIQRTPTQTNAMMRPPSRATPLDQQQRSGSNAQMTPRIASQSPRPLSSQGVQG